MGIHFDIENVHIRKSLKENSFAFHNRLAGQCSTVTQAQDGRSIRQHSYEVAFGGVLVGFFGILFDIQYRNGNTGCIS